MTKQTDTSAEAVERLVKLLVSDAEHQNAQPFEMTGLLPDDEYTIAETLCALSAERDRYKDRAERAVDAYREGLEAAAKRHVYYAHQYERIGATADAEAHMEHARQIRALPVPPEFRSESTPGFGETNDQ